MYFCRCPSTKSDDLTLMHAARAWSRCNALCQIGDVISNAILLHTKAMGIVLTQLLLTTEFGTYVSPTKDSHTRQGEKVIIAMYPSNNNQQKHLYRLQSIVLTTDTLHSCSTSGTP